jgi:16S rRNA processing protein RimM
MIKKEDCFKIGEFVKTHGLNGDLVISVENDFPEQYEEESIFVDIDGGLVPFFIGEDGLRSRNHTSYIIKLDDIDSSEAAERFIEASVYVSKEFFTEEDAMSLNMLKGFLIIDETKGELAKIDSIDDYSGNIVFTILINSIEVMIPLVEEQVLGIDYDNQTITLQLPEGLIDLYLED